ncbi:MAG TPA: peptidoglycan-associated lipoprotein Pal [Thermodesulfobacteriota bacterium]|nr:peptidoglycan-associated lipoprotein Pal [Thermodesulfobacteriota bacterium]
MVKKKHAGLGWLLALLILSGLFLLACGKKEIKTDGLTGAPVGEQVKEDDAEKAKKRARIREQELTEEQLREKTLREKALAEEEARRQAMAAGFENEDVFFEFDQFVLSDSAKAVLNKKAKWLKDRPNAKALIEGHCDERGSTEYNLALGQKRAEAAMQFILALGIEPSRVSTISYGKEKPVDPGNNEAAWAKNRRAHFILK